MKHIILHRLLIVAAGLLLHCLSAQADEILFAERLSAQHFIARDMSSRPALQTVLDELEYNSVHKVMSYRRDFDGDGHTDDLIRAALSLCGNGGCPYALVDGRTQKNHRAFIRGHAACQLHQCGWISGAVRNEPHLDRNQKLVVCGVRWQRVYQGGELALKWCGMGSLSQCDCQPAARG
jgi:hypothetical protein